MKDTDWTFEFAKIAEEKPLDAGDFIGTALTAFAIVVIFAVLFAIPAGNFVR